MTRDEYRELRVRLGAEAMRDAGRIITSADGGMGDCGDAKTKSLTRAAIAQTLLAADLSRIPIDPAK